MAVRKVPFKTNVNRKIRPFDRSSKFSKYGFRKPVRTTKVDVKKEKLNLIKWLVVWVLLLPLSIYAVFWMLVLVIDLFR